MRAVSGLLPLLLLGACATIPPATRDYSAFNAANPRSILVVPVINNSAEVEAGDLLLTTLAVPLAERGFYVLPVTAARKVMQGSGMGDPGLVHRQPTPELARLFGADAVLYVEIDEWKSSYAVVSTGIQVGMVYTLKDGRSDALLWQDQQAAFLQTSQSTGNIFADLLVAAVTAAVDNSRADYTPIANMATAAALSTPGQGLPFGPHTPMAAQNATLFPSTGSGLVSDATRPTLAWQGGGQPGREGDGNGDRNGDGNSNGDGAAPATAGPAGPAPTQADPTPAAPTPAAPAPAAPAAPVTPAPTPAPQAGPSHN